MSDQVVLEGQTWTNVVATTDRFCIGEILTVIMYQLMFLYTITGQLGLWPLICLHTVYFSGTGYI
jgi:hypothetical protein